MPRHRAFNYYYVDVVAGVSRVINGSVRVCVRVWGCVCVSSITQSHWAYHHQTWQMDSTWQVLVIHCFWWRSGFFRGSRIIFQDSLPLENWHFSAYISKLWTDLNDFYWRCGRGPKTNRLDFGGDPNHDPDPGFLNPDQDPYWRSKGQMSRSAWVYTTRPIYHSRHSGLSVVLVAVVVVVDNNL